MKLQHALGLAAAVALAASGPPVLQAQAPATLPLDSIALNDLAAFSEPPGNWRIVGGVAADRARNLRVTTSPGSGVVVNTAKPGDGGDLRTTWEHGDIDLELEFMVPRASNSGIYFQGRYELQLLDSWGVEHPTYGDVGGIYEKLLLCRRFKVRPAIGYGALKRAIFVQHNVRSNERRLWASRSCPIRLLAAKLPENGSPKLPGSEKYFCHVAGMSPVIA